MSRVWVRESSLQNATDALRHVFEAAPLAILLLDRSGRIRLCGHAVEPILGWSAADLVGHKGSELESIPKGRHREARQFVSAVLRGKIVNGLETQRLRKDGTIVQVSLSGAPLHDSQGRVIGMIEDISERKHLQADLKALTARLLNAQEDERQRVSRMLHDDLNQKLAMTAVALDFLASHLPSNPERIRQAILAVHDQVASISDDVHRIAYDLHPSMLNDIGLADPLRSEIKTFSRREGIRVSYRESGVPRKLPAQVISCLYRTAQESLANIARHSEARRASISLRRVGDCLVLTINDRGTGFDSGAAGRRAGIGLISMEERVKLIGGTFSLKTKPGKGVAIRVRVPIPAA